MLTEKRLLLSMTVACAISIGLTVLRWRPGTANARLYATALHRDERIAPTIALAAIAPAFAPAAIAPAFAPAAIAPITSCISTVGQRQPLQIKSTLQSVRVFFGSDLVTFFDIRLAQSNTSIQPSVKRMYNDLMWLDFSYVALYQGTILLQSPESTTSSYVEHRLQYRLPSIYPDWARPEFKIVSHACETFRHETAFWVLHKPKTSAWTNGYHFHNNLLLPLASNILTHPNCAADFQCNPPLVVYHDNIGLKITDFRHQVLDLLFPMIKSTREFTGKEKYCLEYLTLGNGPPPFLNHMNSNQVDVSCALRYSVSSIKQKLRGHLALMSSLRMHTSLNLLFFGQPRAGNPRKLLETGPKIRWVGDTSAIQRVCNDLNVTYTQLEEIHQPLRRVLGLLHSADIVAGPHGAGLTNFIYSASGAVLIDFMTTDEEWIPEFSRIALANAGSPTRGNRRRPTREY